MNSLNVFETFFYNCLFVNQIIKHEILIKLLIGLTFIIPQTIFALLMRFCHLILLRTDHETYLSRYHLII